MKKKLDTRFPAARIKKIMQTDEDIGKIAMAVPLLVSKALELFLQDLCDRTYDVTLRRGAKTLNSSHLKQCVQNFNVFDFLREIVSKVPDMGGPEAASDDNHCVKRRKVADVEENGNDEEFHRGVKAHDIVSHTTSNGRGRGRGRGRPRGSGRTTVERQHPTAHYDKYEDDPDLGHDDDEDDAGKYSPGVVQRLNNNGGQPRANLKENVPPSLNCGTPVHDFDLNADLDENGESKPVSPPPAAAAAPPLVLFPASAAAGQQPSLSPKSPLLKKHMEFLGWSFADVEKMDIDPSQLANLNRMDEDDEEDYDEED
ncbi:unnamed protein product [Linum tenue]|uniref:Transcription factor CBF/NF-Y/archaeal histone domain-containing protein n=1 Tax=Linum tenue TaxID=586396 RepID=A0AAV0QAK9_9ROSI|nr:unnamed protein product [Linum tenue]